MDRRASPRSPIRCEIDCQAGKQTFRAVGFDISEHGIAFVTPTVLPQNTEAVLRYRLEPDAPLIIAHVVICQQVEGRVGARFIEQNKEAHAARK